MLPRRVSLLSVGAMSGSEAALSGSRATGRPIGTDMTSGGGGVCQAARVREGDSD